MAGPRPLIVFRERPERIAVQQQAAAVVTGFQTLHPHFPRVQQQRFETVEEEDIGRMAACTLWDSAHQQQRQALAAAAAVRRQEQRVNSRASLANHVSTTPLIRHGPGPGQPSDWDGGGLARHIAVATSGRLDRHLLVDETVMRSRQQPVGLAGEMSRGISGEILAGWRLTEAREEIRKSEFLQAVGRGWDTSHATLLEDAARERAELSRAYQHSAATQQLEPSPRTRSISYGWEETGHSDLIARYGSRLSSRNLERAHAAIVPAFQPGNQSRKRSRDEEADCDREKLIRHRRLSGIDSPPSSIIHSQSVFQRKGANAASKAECRRLHVEEDEHEEGQLTPPPSMITSHLVQRGAECKAQLFKQEQDIIVASRTEVGTKRDVDSPRFQDAFAFAAFQETAPHSRSKSSTSRPSTARENLLLLADQFQPLNFSKEQTLLRRERYPSPKLKDDERMLTRLERVVDGIDTYSVLSSDLQDLRKRVIKESEIRILPVTSKIVEKDQDGPQYKRQQQVQSTHQRDLRSPHNYRRNRLGGEVLDKILLERRSKESNDRVDYERRSKESNDRVDYERRSKESNDRIDYDVKRQKTRAAALKDSRQAGEMTISWQKYGQRTVKVEGYKPRDLSTRASRRTSRDERSSHRGAGSLRDASDPLFPVTQERDRLSIASRKDAGGRLQAAGRDKVPRSQSCKSGIRRQEHRQRCTSLERIPKCSQHDKNEVDTATEKHDVDPYRHHSIFSRLSGLKTDTSINPETSSPNLRTVAETLSQDDNTSLVNERMPLSSPSKEISSFNGVHDDIVDFQGFPISSRDIEGADPGVMNMSGRNTGQDWASSRQTGPSRDRLNVDSLKIKVIEYPKRDSLQRSDSAVVRFPHIERNIYTSYEKGPGGLQRDSRLSESPVVQEQEQCKLHPEGHALPIVEAGDPSLVNSPDLGCAESHEPLLGNGCKSLPKVISTGHKKDQVSKKGFSNPDQSIGESSSIPIAVTDLVPVNKAIHDKSEGNILTVPPERMPEISECMQEPPHNCSSGPRFGSSPSLSDHDNASPSSSLEDEKTRNIGKSVEAIQNVRLLVGTGCTPLLLASGQPSECAWKTDDTSTALDRHEDGSMASEVHADRAARSGLLSALMPCSNLSSPKEVRLFGANLNAPLCERLDSTPKPLDTVDQDVVDTSVLLGGTVDAHVTASLDSTPAIQELEKDVRLPVALTVDKEAVDLEEPWKTQEKPLTHCDVVKAPTSLAPDVSLVKVQCEKPPSILKEQYVPPPKATTTQVRQVTSSHSTGAHTWRRGISSTASANSANVLRGPSVFSGVGQTAGRARGGQEASYVRKGNSLVRASGAVSALQPANDVKATAGFLLGQTRPTVRQPSMVKSSPFRNTFVANPANSKSFYPIHRKYLAPPTENDGTPSVRLSNSPNLPYSSSESGISLPQASAIPKPPLQISLKVTSPPKPAALLTANLDQQTGAHPSLELPGMDGSGDNIVEAGFCQDNSSAMHSMPVVSTAGNPGSAIVQNPILGNRLYVRRKANQLVVAPSQSVDFLPAEIQRSQASKTGLVSGLYVKRKVNQLVRSNAGKGSTIQKFVHGLLGSCPSTAVTKEQGGGSMLTPKKMRLGRALRQKKGPTGQSSWVWTLKGAALGQPGAFSPQSLGTAPLLPWKRQHSLKTPVRSQRLRHLPEGKKGSLLFLMSKRLRRVRPVQPVYTRSADGFSLHRSGVMSLGGGNLKWTKSLDRRAKQASEAATKAVAEVERRKRENKEAVVEAASKVKAARRASRRATRGEGERIVWVGLVRYRMDAASKTLQQMPDAQGTPGDIDTIATTGLAPPLLTPKRSIIGGTVYLRVGNGNQLVRDPKAASRALASEKVRWSLHNARSRGAKKQQFCQFFTKFGKCNKENGKCPYIHDPDKVAVCTKFLKGSCTDGQCLLTHKVIPERMPDCSFFLEGLCTNENCPYRHVNVNPKAAYCDGFLRGYCKDGDKCNKKHRYICSVYAETGECLDGSVCKFHHPKKKEKPYIPINGRKIGTKRKRRYFSSIEPYSLEQQLDTSICSEDNSVLEDEGSPEQGTMDFISLSNIESDEDQKVTVQSQSWSMSGLAFGMREAGLVEEAEKWIKPTFLLKTTAH